MYIAALDIGGTKTIAAILDEKGSTVPFVGRNQPVHMQPLRMDCTR